jgi:hypothetical protein
MFAQASSPNDIPRISRDEQCDRDTGWKAQSYKQRKGGSRGEGRRLVATRPLVMPGSVDLRALSLITQPSGRRAPVQSGRVGRDIKHAIRLLSSLSLHFLCGNQDS